MTTNTLPARARHAAPPVWLGTGANPQGPRDVSLRDGMNAVLESARLGAISEDEAQQLLSEMIGRWAEREATTLLQGALRSLAQPATAHRPALRSRQRPPIRCPVCGAQT